MDKTIEIADELVKAAQDATGEADERKAVEQVLREMTARKRSPLDGMLELAGKNPLRDDYDYKALRAGDGDDDHR
jgi:Arc/MetJ family transcription regulator